MYGPAGTVYVYFTYGCHHMLNLVCCEQGTAGAVLVRAIEPSINVESMRARRPGRRDADLCSGPGKLTQRLGVDLSDNGSTLGDGRVNVYDYERGERLDVGTSGRVGLSEGHELELRFYVIGSPYVSRGRTGAPGISCPQPAGRRRTLKLRQIYDTCVKAGIEADSRERAEIDKVLELARKKYDKLDEADKPFFDEEKLTNPYSDTRIGAGDPESEIRGLLVGVDMEICEVVLADRLREHGAPIDLVFAHHPEGPGFANLHEVMYMQADLWAAQGVSIAAADALIAPRAEEIRRRIMPNHYWAIQAAELLGFALMSCHTPADNSVNGFVQRIPRRAGSSDARRRRESASGDPRVCRRRPQGLRSADRAGERVGASWPHRRRHDRGHRGPERRTRPAVRGGCGDARRHALLRGAPEARRGAQAQPGDRRPHLERRAGHEPHPRRDRDDGSGRDRVHERHGSRQAFVANHARARAPEGATPLEGSWWRLACRSCCRWAASAWA